jgi:hypothetical protein
MFGFEDPKVSWYYFNFKILSRSKVQTHLLPQNPNLQLSTF